MMRYLAATLLLTSCYGASPGDKKVENQNPQQPEVCVPSAVTDEKDVKISFTATKDGDTPVPGTLDGKAKLVVPAKGLKGTKVTITFNPTSVDTGVELRDTRIATIFFDNLTITFTGQVSAIDKDTLPADGETRKVTITGNLSMAGQTVATTAYAVITNTDGTIELEHDSSKPSTVNAQGTQALKINVRELLKAANVTSMAANVGIEGSLYVVKTCS